MGRPTSAPKSHELKFRADDQTTEMLKECSIKLGVSQAEVLRRAVHKIYEELREQSK